MSRISLDPILINQLSQIVQNATSRILRLRERNLDPRRDIDDECGYPKTVAITPKDYRELYDREWAAARVVELFPLECWQVQPEIYEDESSDVLTPFEEAWQQLVESLRAGSYFRGQEGNPIWEVLLRTDILSGIGRFGIILLGLDDGAPLSQEPQQKSKTKLLYLRPFDETAVTISRFERNQASPRYGLPLSYHIQLSHPSDNGDLFATDVEVHWKRVVHIADNLTSSEVFGVPRMRPVLDRLLDLRKILPASAETFYRNLGIFALETHPQLGGDVEVDVNRLRDQLEQMLNGLQRWILTRGMTAKMLAPAVVDPGSHLDTQLTAICVKLGVPKRIFMGSERGQLASSQDERAWIRRIKARQQNYLTPRVIVPFVDRLIDLNVLPKPKQYYVWWPEEEFQTPLERVQIAAAKTGALAQYVSGGLDAVITPLDYLVRVLGFEADEAEAILASAIEDTEREKKETPEVTAHVFCPTGPGGGVDPTCGKGGEKGRENTQALVRKHLRRTEKRHFKQLNMMKATLDRLKNQGRLNEAGERLLQDVLRRMEYYREKVHRIEQEGRTEKEEEEKEEEEKEEKKIASFNELVIRYQEVQPEAKEPPKNVEERERHYSQANPVAAKQLIGGTSEVYRVQFEDGTQAIYKPKSGEHPDLRPNVPSGEYYLREAAAYDVAKELGMQDLVPVTVTRDIPGKGVGVFQEYIPGVDARDIPTEYRYGSTMKNFARAAVFNFLIGNTDRHAGNWRVRSDKPGLISLIDHGLAFPVNHSLPPLSEFIMIASREKVKIPKFVQKIEPKRIEQILIKHGLINAIPHTMKRLEILKQTPNFREAAKRIPELHRYQPELAVPLASR